MKKVKDTITNAASHSSGDGLKLLSERGNPINVTCKFYDVTFISHFVTSTLHLHKAQIVQACQICEIWQELASWLERRCQASWLERRCRLKMLMTMMDR